MGSPRKRSKTSLDDSPISSRWSVKNIDGEKKIRSGCVKQSRVSEVEMMKERFPKLLLGEDMSGSRNGVCTALAISNAITNLCATLFGQLWRLEPLPTEKKEMWRREMEWLLCVNDHIVEMTPTWQTFPDGTKLEIMSCRPRSDLYANLPDLRKLENMLFAETETLFPLEILSSSHVSTIIKLILKFPQNLVSTKSKPLHLLSRPPRSTRQLGTTFSRCHKALLNEKQVSFHVVLQLPKPTSIAQTLASCF